jgi:FkbM family methyltransferase
MKVFAAVIAVHRAALARLVSRRKRLGRLEKILRGAVLVPIFGSMLVALRLWARFRGPLETKATTQFGARFTCRLPDFIQTYLYLFGVWEPDITAYIGRRLAPGRTFIDVGANIGYHALLASVGGQSPVVAIEASPRIFRMLQDEVRVNDAGSVRLVNAAVSDQTGSCAVYGGPLGNIGLSTTVRQRGFDAEAEVVAAPLGDLLEPQELRTAQLVKIDVEGGEDAVLRGMTECLKACPDDVEILVELSPQWWSDRRQTPVDVLRPLLDAGFHVYRIDNNLWPWRYLWPNDVRPPVRVAEPLTKRVKRLDLVLSRTDRPTL